MVKYRLVYFDFKGKGELARLIFAAARQDYEDVRYEYSPDSEQWLKYKPKTPFGRLPVLEILNDDGKVVNRLAQSVAIARYLANKFGFNAKNEIDIAEADAYADQITDFAAKVVDYIVETDSEKLKVLVENMDKTVLPINLKIFEDKIKENKSGYLIGDSLTWTDLYLLDIIDWFDDEYKGKILEKYHVIKQHYERVKSNEAIAEWLSRRPVTKY